MTIYPAQIDNSSTIAISVDGQTSPTASLLNSYRSAIIALETTLGVNPSTVYGTVANRISTLETAVNNIAPITLTQDLGGTLAAPVVVGIQGRPISSMAPNVGQALAWNGISWAPANSITASVTMSGDVSGASSSNVVVNINGASVPAAGSLVAGKVLQVSGGSSLTYGALNLSNVNSVAGVLPAGNQAAQTLSGDVSGTTASAIVSKVNGSTVPAGGSLIAGNTLQVTGSSSLGYSSINLAGGSNVITGTLPVGNQASQTMLGDVTGTTGASTVVNVHGASVPAAGSLTTGNVLQVSGSSALSYGAINLAGGSNFVSGVLPVGNQASQTMAGDVTGTTGTSTVAKLQGNAVKSGTLGSVQDGYVLTWVNSGNDWEAKPSAGGSGTLSGDVTGSSSSTTVAAIRGHTVKSQTLSSAQDGYVLTWINSNNDWEAVQGSGSGIPSGPASGDLTGNFPGPTVSKLRGVSLSSNIASPTAYQSVTFDGTSYNTVPIAQVYNVRSYGAVGNGFTDDTAAITAANTAANGSGIIHFPVGNYKITTVTLTTNCRFDVGAIITPSGNLNIYAWVDASPTQQIFSSTANVVFQNQSAIGTAPHVREVHVGWFGAKGDSLGGGGGTDNTQAFRSALLAAASTGYESSGAAGGCKVKLGMGTYRVTDVPFTIDGKTSAVPIWQANTSYSAPTTGGTTPASAVIPSPANGYYYSCAVSGTSGSTQPTFPTSINATVVDGYAIWRCMGPVTPYDMVGIVIEGMKTQGTTLPSTWIMCDWKEASGTTASLSSSAVLTGVTGFNAADVGTHIYLANSSGALQDGGYRISAINSATSITLFDPIQEHVFTNDANNGSLHWTRATKACIRIWTSANVVRGVYITPGNSVTGEVLYAGIEDNYQPLLQQILTNNFIEYTEITTYADGQFIAGLVHGDNPVTPNQNTTIGDGEDTAYENCFIANFALYGFYCPNGGGQNKDIRFRRTQISGYGPTTAGLYGRACLYMVSGSYTYDGGGIGKCQVAFYGPADPAMIMNVDSEGAVRFVKQSNNLVILGCRIASSNINADGNHIMCGGGTNVSLFGVRWDVTPYVPNFGIVFGNTGSPTQGESPGELTAIGCIFPNNNPFKAGGAFSRLVVLNCKGNDGTGNAEIPNTSHGAAYRINPVTNSNSPYTMLITESVIQVDTTAGPVTVKNYTAPSNGSYFTIKDVGNNAATNHITVQANGSSNFATYTIEDPSNLGSFGSSGTIKTNGACVLFKVDYNNSRISVVGMVSSMAGDVTGSVMANTVTKIQGNAVKSQTLGSTQDGYVLTWVNANSDWEATIALNSGLRQNGSLVDFINATTTTTAPSAGGAGALPATPAGYLSVKISGVTRQIPYY